MFSILEIPVFWLQENRETYPFLQLAEKLTTCEEPDHQDRKCGNSRPKRASGTNQCGKFSHCSFHPLSFCIYFRPLKPSCYEKVFVLYIAMIIVKGFKQTSCDDVTRNKNGEGSDRYK